MFTSPGGRGAVDAAGLAAITGLLQRAVAGDLAGGCGGAVGVAQAELFDQIQVLEQLKSVCSALQATRTVQFAAARETELSTTTASTTESAAAVSEARSAAGASAAKQAEARRDIGAQIGLARKVSPIIGTRLVGVAKVLVAEMPQTMYALTAGRIDEWQAQSLVKETATLTLDHRRLVDLELADHLGLLTCAQAVAFTNRIGYRLDAAQAVKRIRKAEGDRHVSLRRGKDCMTYLTATLPIVEGVAAFADLTRYADTARNAGDPRSKNMLMADHLVHALTHPAGSNAGTVSAGTGPTTVAAGPVTFTTTLPAADGVASGAAVSGGPVGTASPTRSETHSGPPVAVIGEPVEAEVDCAATAIVATSDAVSVADKIDADQEPAELAAGLAGIPAGVNIEIHLVMTDRVLFDGDDEPAIITGHGPIPAALARHLIGGADHKTKTWVRRLYTDPHTGQLTGTDPKRRLFTPTARQFLITRDQLCRTPWCGAPIRHADHTQPHATGGTTDPANGNGRCARCNLIEELKGWRNRTNTTGTLTITTPTGHHYTNDPPPPPDSEPWTDVDPEIRKVALRRLALLKRAS